LRLPQRCGGGGGGFLHGRGRNGTGALAIKQPQDRLRNSKQPTSFALIPPAFLVAVLGRLMLSKANSLARLECRFAVRPRRRPVP
jgi:hypothetical protein